jgi:hypothetical protein
MQWVDVDVTVRDANPGDGHLVPPDRRPHRVHDDRFTRCHSGTTAVASISTLARASTSAPTNTSDIGG